MSHFTKCDLKMTNVEALKKALGDMELNVVEAEAGQSVVVRGYRGQTLAADLKIDMGTYDIGVVKNDDGTLDLVADWWGVSGREANALFVGSVDAQGFFDLLTTRIARL